MKQLDEMTCKCGRPRYRTTSGVLVDKCGEHWWREESKKDKKNRLAELNEIISNKQCERIGCEEFITIRIKDRRSISQRYCCDLCRRIVAQELRKLTVEREKLNAE